LSGSNIPLLLFKFNRPMRTMNVNNLITYNYFFTRIQKDLFIPLPNIFILKDIKTNNDLKARQYNAVTKMDKTNFFGIVNCNNELSALLTYLILRTLYDYKTSIELYTNTKCANFVSIDAIKSVENRLGFIFKTVTEYYSKSVDKLLVDKDIFPFKKFMKLLELMDLSRTTLIGDNILIPIKNIPDYTGDLSMFINAVKTDCHKNHDCLREYLSFITLDYFSKTYIYSHSFNTDYGGDQVIEVDYQVDGVNLRVIPLDEELPYLKKYKVKHLDEGMRVSTKPLNILFIPHKNLYVLESHYFYSKSVRYSSRVFKSLEFTYNHLYINGEYINSLSVSPHYTYSPVFHNIKSISSVK